MTIINHHYCLLMPSKIIIIDTHCHHNPAPPHNLIIIHYYQVVIWAACLLFVPETPAHFIRWVWYHHHNHHHHHHHGYHLGHQYQHINMLLKVDLQQWSRFCCQRSTWVAERHQQGGPGQQHVHQQHHVHQHHLVHDLILTYKYCSSSFSGVLPNQAKPGWERPALGWSWRSSHQVKK